MSLNHLEQRKNLVEIINKYKQKYPDEAHFDVDRLIEKVKKDPDCFERNKIPGVDHLSSNVVLFTKGYKELLGLWHEKIQEWTFPGGHSEGNPNIHKTGEIELEEETGIKGVNISNSVPFHIHHFEYDENVYGYKKGIYAFYFAAILPEGQTPEIMEPDKCSEMKWFSLSGFSELVGQGKYDINEFIYRKWIQLQKEKAT